MPQIQGMYTWPVSITTDASGDATEYTSAFSGYIHAIRYVPDGSSPLDTGADITVTTETHGLAVLSMTNIGTSAFTRTPRTTTHTVTGTARTYDGTAEVLDRIPVVNDRVKFVVAQGGNTLSGTFYVLASTS